MHEAEPGDFDLALTKMRSSVAEWLATARNHARHSNEGGQFDELADYPKRVKRW